MNSSSKFYVLVTGLLLPLIVSLSAAIATVVISQRYFSERHELVVTIDKPVFGFRQAGTPIAGVEFGSDLASVTVANTGTQVEDDIELNVLIHSRTATGLVWSAWHSTALEDYLEQPVPEMLIDEPTEKFVRFRIERLYPGQRFGYIVYTRSPFAMTATASNANTWDSETIP